MRRLSAGFVIIIASLAAMPAAAQSVVTSAGPASVDVTVYRDPGRDPRDELELGVLDGYALISETRQVSLPAGESEIRFEGVAGGIVPQSAIITGFPEGIVERNRDAYLLSPESLLDRSLGRRVHLRRTSRATGQVREQNAVVRSGADGAVLIQTAEGVEALRCTGLNETLVYDEVPPGLSARPTLSVRARASRPVTATVTLAYLADGFDWQANYIAQLAPSGDRVDLFAWLTLASNDETSFVNADTQAVAGRLNREAVETDEPAANPLQLRCWPQGRTSDIPLEVLQRLPMGQAQQFEESNIVVTGSRIPAQNMDSVMPVTTISAQLEALGDLKLYRIPEPVTVAANSQKQVALLQRSDVHIDLVYRQHLTPGEANGTESAQRTLVTRNREADGLGIPLPGGRLVAFAAVDGRPVVVGEGGLRDRAVGEDVEVELGASPGVNSQTRLVRDGKTQREFDLTVTNDHPTPVRYEAEFAADEGMRFRPAQHLDRRDGRPLWAVTVPANGSASLRYRVAVRDD